MASDDRIAAILAKKNLHSFLQYVAWPAVNGAVPYQDNWHIEAICEHLEAVASGQIKRLIINMPFRLLKSTIVSQAFPAWEWLQRPNLQYLTASYAKDVAIRDAVASRRIIESDLYRHHYGHLFKMTTDQNVKSRYDNDKGGSRTISSTDGAATGFGGNRIIIDDPISAKDADSLIARQTAIEYWRGTASTRLNDAQNDAIIIVHQRLNEQDLTGYVLAEESEVGWEHLILPMRYEAASVKQTCIGYKDPRTTEGELLFPDRLNESTVKKIEVTLGSYHTAAQLQQKPNKRGGTIIHGEWIKRYNVLPVIEHRYMYADTAQKTKESNDYSVIQIWGKSNGRIYLLDQLRGRWEAPELKRRAIAFWEKHVALTNHDNGIGPLRKFKVEDKSSGTGLIQDIQETGGIPIEAIERDRDKYTRVLDGLSYLEAGLVYIPEAAAYTSDFITECEAFTSNDSHLHDDQIDPMMDAIKDMLGGVDKIAQWIKLGKR